MRSCNAKVHHQWPMIRERRLSILRALRVSGDDFSQQNDDYLATK